MPVVTGVPFPQLPEYHPSEPPTGGIHDPEHPEIPYRFSGYKLNLDDQGNIVTQPINYSQPAYWGARSVWQYSQKFG